MTLRPLHHAVGAWTPGSDIAVDPLTALTAAWPSIVGEDIARNTRPLEITRDALVVATRSSAWSQQLAFLSERVLECVRERGIPKHIERLRFRVGRVARASPQRNVSRRAPVEHWGARTLAAPATAQEAVQRFRDDVAAVERAKVGAGWKQCVRCGARVAPKSGPACVPCDNMEREQRRSAVSRLLFEMPWLGYAGTAAVVRGLSAAEYEAIRRHLLGRWWEVLARIRRTGQRSMTRRERLIASSYLLLKSGIEPERLASAVVRDLLGDEIHAIIYGNGNA